jgi:uncharacterized membrane protein YfcA
VTRAFLLTLAGSLISGFLGAGGAIVMILLLHDSPRLVTAGSLDRMRGHALSATIARH